MSRPPPHAAPRALAVADHARALATGNLTIAPNAVVREITKDRNTGLANGAFFFDRVSKREYHVNARVVVVGASTLESTRLLLNSNLATSNDALGHYLFDQTYTKNIIEAIVPEAKGGKARGLTGGGGYIVRFRNLQKREKNFLRGYSYDFHSGSTPNALIFPRSHGAALERGGERRRRGLRHDRDGGSAAAPRELRSDR